MRSVDAAVMSNRDSDRQVDGYITVYKDRLTWTEMSQRTIDSSISANIYSMDACEYNGGILRVASVGASYSTQYLYVQYIANPTSTPWPSWVSANIHLAYYTRPGVRGNRIWFLEYGASEPTLKYGDWNTGTGSMGTTVSFDDVNMTWPLTNDTPCALAPVNTQEAYMMRQAASSDSFKYGNIAYLKYNSSSTDYTYRLAAMRVYGENTIRHFDAERITIGSKAMDYVLYTDENEKRTWIISADEGYAYSNPKPVVPLDVVDDTTLFTATALATTSHHGETKLVATGIYKRTNGMAMQAYMLGSVNGSTAGFLPYPSGVGWSIGRDLYVGTTGVEDFLLSGSNCPALGGKMMISGSYVYYIGPGVAYQATRTALVGGTSPSTTMSVNNASVVLDGSGMGHAVFDIPSDATLTNVIGGSRVVFFAGYNSNYARMGTYEVDNIATQYGNGKLVSIVCRPVAIKRLQQWRCDASFDYWSQAKQHTDAPSLTELVVAQGEFDVDGSGHLKNVNLNERGIKYAVAKEARGYHAEAKYYYPTDANLLPEVGVILNFHMETRYEASERLGIEPKNVAANQYGYYGIIVAWSPVAHGGNPGIGIWFAYQGDDTWQQLTSFSLSVPADTWFWIGGAYEEGQIRAYYRLHSSNTWTTVGTAAFAYASGSNHYMPHYKYNTGRAGLIMKSHDNTLSTSNRVICDTVNIYSTEPEWSFSAMAAELAMKAGIVTATPETVYDGTSTISWSHSGWNLTSNSTQKLKDGAGILHFRITSGTEIGVAGLTSGGSLGGSVNGGIVSVTYSKVRYYTVTSGSASQTFEYNLEDWQGAKGWVSVSWQEDFVTLYVNGRYAGSFFTGIKPLSLQYVSNGSATFYPYWEEIDLRVDNYIFDMGQTGEQLLRNLIRQKRIFFQDTNYGNLKYFRNKTEINNGSPDSMSVSAAISDMDSNRITRVRLEGAEFSEAFDETVMNNYGNIFSLANAEELNTQEEFDSEVQLILDDFVRASEQTTLVAAADPRIEPNDIYEARVYYDATNYEFRHLHVKQIEFRLNITENSAAFDMNVIAESGS